MNNPRIIGVYLGAGKSIRMGRNKLELPFGEFCLGSWGLQAAIDSQLDWIIAVTRKGDPLHWLAPFSKKKGWSCLRCDEADYGQSASLKAGLRAATGLGADAVVMMLADQPFVTASLLNRLVEGFVASPEGAFVAASLQPPVLFAKRVFPDLLQLEGDCGARALIRGKWSESGKVLAVVDEPYMLDIDTAAEYEFYAGEGSKWM
ncbi:NTP transferase domain-containing protein [Bacillota bacterium Lsc_1132]